MSVSDEYDCPICAEEFKEGVPCSMDVDLGVCHAECLDGSPVVDLETGEEKPDGKVWVFPFERPWIE